MSAFERECKGCLGFDAAHSCQNWAAFQILKKEKNRCRACEAKDKKIAEIEADIADEVATRLLANERITELDERLELYGTNAKTGERVRLPDDCDGIACRDETIRLLDSRIAELEAENERLESMLSQIPDT